jgi:hypothetical protein
MGVVERTWATAGTRPSMRFTTPRYARQLAAGGSITATRGPMEASEICCACAATLAGIIRLSIVSPIEIGTLTPASYPPAVILHEPGWRSSRNYRAC